MPQKTEGYVDKCIQINNKKIKRRENDILRREKAKQEKIEKQKQEKAMALAANSAQDQQMRKGPAAQHLVPGTTNNILTPNQIA